MVRIRGSYALAVMFKEYPGEIYVARKDSPMILGVTDGECYVASDVPAILKYTRNVYYIGNMEMARLKEGQITFYNLDGDEITREMTQIEWNAEAAEKGGFEHFMMKEIHEQPKAVSDTLNSVLKNGRLDLTEMGLTEEEICAISQIYIVACGSAYHVGVVAQYVMEDLAEIPVRVDVASEFRYRKPLLDKNGLVIVVSQSGETADSLAALREAKEYGVKTLAIVNVIGSSIAREADHVFYTMAGPEIAVATTKAYSTQLIAVYCLALQFALVRKKLSEEKCAALIAELQSLPGKMEKILEDAPISYIKWDMNRTFSEVFSNGNDREYQGKVCHKYILGVYELYERLTSRFPHVLFESCASGGARFDPGMLYYAPQGWTSDDTDAIERLKIQYGTSMVYPVSCMGSHVSASPNHQTNRVTPIETRADVAYFGTFGYELDLLKLGEEDKAEIRRQIAFMKEKRDLIQKGTFYRLKSPFEGNETAWMIVSEDQKKALVGYYRVMQPVNVGFKRLKLKGLKEDTCYKVSGYAYDCYGDELMQVGMILSDSASGVWKKGVNDKGDFQAEVFEIVAV